ncbi:hypothetical protein KBB42_03175, partial [Candidatus Dojkabacteria bacterium]|nr:hypothetical protein [Candidatus Dojkabacteria bacterium]
MKNFTQDFLKIFDTPKLDKYSTITVSKGYEEFVAEILGKKLGKSIYLVPKKDTDIHFKEYKVGDKWDISDLISLGYENVERVWSSGEVAVLGENVLIWPFSSKFVFRFVLFGNEIESIEVLEPTNRKRVDSKSTVKILSNTQDTVVGNEIGGDMLILECIPNIFLEEDVVDMGIRGLPYFSVASLTKSSINILEDYKNRGYEIWYISNDLFKYDSDNVLSKYITRTYEVNDSVEQSLRKGFLYEKGKILVLTDTEVLGEILLKHEGMDKEIDASSIDLLKKVLVGDFVVHEDHGIGKFLGIVEKEDTQYIEIGYAGNDRLFVPLYSSSKVMKYIGSGKAQPILTGLNSGVWSRVSS